MSNRIVVITETRKREFAIRELAVAMVWIQEQVEDLTHYTEVQATVTKQNADNRYARHDLAPYWEALVFASKEDR